MKSRHADFYRGVAAALTVVAEFDEQTVFEEILKNCGGEEVIQQARRDGVLRLSGFTKYRRATDAQ